MRLLRQVQRRTVETPIPAFLTVQLVCLCVEESAPVPDIAADAELSLLDAWVRLLGHDLLGMLTVQDKARLLA